ncbi:MAG TPA: sorbosone dehydrogenase family protein [Spirochaetia bacterium]|nr:sorbosone dehydrogenase family protein [Spirochaetia bacterium]
MIRSGLNVFRLYVILGLVLTLPVLSALAVPLGLIKLPPGFSIALYTDTVPNARSMTLGEKGTLFVGTRKGTVYAVLDTDRDNRADKVITLASRLDSPNGVAFRKGDLYVAEINRVLMFKGIEDHLYDPPYPTIIDASFPADRHHGWKFIRFGPDGRLYVPVGAPCNDCLKEDERYATIMRMEPDGSGLSIFARGVRNTVGYDWHPETGELWFTDNGRDWLGDDRPPDELNHAPRKGMHFGFPYRHGRYMPDPQYGTMGDQLPLTPPEVELGPHVAALGMRFYTGNMFPGEYRNQIFIAEHGSWNRSVPIGYRITLVRLLPNKSYSYSVFAEGWLQSGRSWGRPVDVLVMPDGALLVSDDQAGAVYRISYGNRNAAP